MSKDEFREMFLQALEIAINNAEAKLGSSVPHNYEIELHDPVHKGNTTNLQTAVDRLFLGEDQFYYVIDVGVKEISADSVKVFVRVSGHQPVNFSNTWQGTAGERLFKQVFPEIKVDSR